MNPSIDSYANSVWIPILGWMAIRHVPMRYSSIPFINGLVSRSMAFAGKPYICHGKIDGFGRFRCPIFYWTKTHDIFPAQHTMRYPQDIPVSQSIPCIFRVSIFPTYHRQGVAATTDANWVPGRWCLFHRRKVKERSRWAIWMNFAFSIFWRNMEKRWSTCFTTNLDLTEVIPEGWWLARSIPKEWWSLSGLQCEKHWLPTSRWFPRVVMSSWEDELLAAWELQHGNIYGQPTHFYEDF